MNKRIKKKLYKRGYIFHYADAKKFKFVVLNILDASDSNKNLCQVKLSLDKIFPELKYPNRNGITFSKTLLEKELKKFYKRALNFCMVPKSMFELSEQTSISFTIMQEGRLYTNDIHNR